MSTKGTNLLQMPDGRFYVMDNNAEEPTWENEQLIDESKTKNAFERLKSTKSSKRATKENLPELIKSLLVPIEFEPIEVSKYMVTQDVYKCVMGVNPSRNKDNCHPQSILM